MRLGVAAIWIVVVFLADRGVCQIPITPVELASGSLSGTSQAILDDWSVSFFSGNWPKLQNDVGASLDGKTIKDVTTAKSTTIDLRADYYRIVFLSKHPVSGDPMLVQFFAHKPAPAPYAERLPGVKSIRQVFVSAKKGQLRSLYLATEEVDPLVASLVAAAQKIPMETIAPLVLFALDVPEDGLLHASVSEASFPFRRAQIVVKMQTKPQPKSPADSDLAKAEERAWEALRREAAPLSACAGLLIDAGHRSFPEAAAKPNWEEARTTLELELANVLSSATCRFLPEADLSGAGGQDFVARRAQYALVTAVYDRYVGLLAEPDLKPVTSDSLIANAPLQRFSVGLVASVMLSTDGEEKRVKLDGGKVQADPFKGTLSMVVLNIHGKAFDPKILRRGLDERFRWTVGVAIAPEFGITAGVGFELVRGLSLNAGVAALRVNALRAGDSLGSAPVDLKKPVKNEAAFAVYAGLGFSL